MVRKIESKLIAIVVILSFMVFAIISSNFVYADTICSDTQISPRWAEVAGHCDDNYTILDNDANYCSSNSSVVYNYVLVPGYATDSTGSEVTLSHQGNNDINQIITGNQTANGSVTVRFVNNIPTSGTYYLCNDTCKMSSLDSHLKISGDSTKVGTGKIMYRTASRSATTMAGVAWQYINLNTINNTNLVFGPNLHVQIVIIYELKEDYLFGIYHHVRIQYCFDTYE